MVAISHNGIKIGETEKLNLKGNAIKRVVQFFDTLDIEIQDTNTGGGGGSNNGSSVNSNIPSSETSTAYDANNIYSSKTNEAQIWIVRRANIHTSVVSTTNAATNPGKPRPTILTEFKAVEFV